jgi:hypothetical protein
VLWTTISHQNFLMYQFLRLDMVKLLMAMGRGNKEWKDLGSSTQP